VRQYELCKTLAKMKERLSITAGIIIISFIIWRILLIKREAYTILERINWFQVIIIISIIIWNVIEIYSINRILKKDMQQGWLVQEIVKGINYVYWGPIASVEARIVKLIPSIRDIVMLIGRQVILICYTKMRLLVMLITFTIIPRLIVGICLAIDVIYYGRIELMYKAIWLLIIPIIFNTILTMIKHAAERNKTELEYDSLTVSYKDGQVYLQSKDTTWAIARYTYNKTLWISSYNIIDIIKAIEIVKISKELLYLRIITQVIYIISWTIYILKIINYLYVKYIIYKKSKNINKISW
jgi:hypothetical protein